MTDILGIAHSIVDDIRRCASRHSQTCPSLEPFSVITIGLDHHSPADHLDEMVECHSLMRLCDLNSRWKCRPLELLDFLIPFVANSTE